MHHVHVALPLVLALAGCTGVTDGETPHRSGEELIIDDGGTCVGVEETPRVELRYRAPVVPRSPRRALLMITGALASAAAYDAPVDGYNCLDRAAAAGYDAFAMSFEGTGASSYPDDGTTVDPTRLLSDAAGALESVRDATGVGSVDLLGSSVGSLIAMQLGSKGSPVPVSHVGGLILTGVVYGSAPSDAMPPLTWAVNGGCWMPGYVASSAADYAPLLATAPHRLAAWAECALPATYALGPLLVEGELATFDASLAQAPALQIWGDADPITTADDVSLFQSSYGGPIALHVMPGGGHVPYYDVGADDAWAAAFEFLDGVHSLADARGSLDDPQ
jgi:pimeloyl-ACP methyl ester carboxylesterase